MRIAVEEVLFTIDFFFQSAKAVILHKGDLALPISLRQSPLWKIQFDYLDIMQHTFFSAAAINSARR